MEVRNDAYNIEKPPGTGKYLSGGSVKQLNYIGFLQFIFIVSYNFIVKYNPTFFMEYPAVNTTNTSNVSVT